MNGSERLRQFCSALRQAIALVCAGLLLAGCATVPRGPASNLADAGISATELLGQQSRATATYVAQLNEIDAFASVYDFCRNTDPCDPPEANPALIEARSDLSSAIELRTKAIQGLKGAYEALKIEAEYDARSDLVGSTNTAISGVNALATFLSSAGGPGGPLVGNTVAKIAERGAGLVADRRQRRRILVANRAIGETNALLSSALQREAYIYDTIADYVALKHTAARLALVDAGLVERKQFLVPLTSSLDLVPAGGAEKIFAKTPAARLALSASIEARSESEVAKTRAKYRAAINALEALSREHDKLAAEDGISLESIERFLGELDGLMTDLEKE